VGVPYPAGQAVLRWIKAGVFLAALLPLVWLVRLGLDDRLGPNPVEALSHATGDWALRFLLITLAVSPLRRLSGWSALLRFRRMLGLFAFFYASLHLLAYLWLDQWFLWAAVVDDLLHRPYILAGMSAFVLLVPLAATSTQGMMRRLGSHWRKLHRLVYPAALLGVLHYLWQAKVDLLDPVIYAVVLALLLALRLPLPFHRRERAVTPRAGPKQGVERPSGV